MAWEMIALAACRITAFMLIAPLAGHRAIPLPIRLLLAVCVSAALAPGAVAGPAATVTPSASNLLGAVLSEILIGVMLGIAAHALVSAATMGGQIVAQMAGLSWQTGDPDQPGPAAQLTGMLALAVFALMRGPELALAAVAQTLADLPPGSSRGQPSPVPAELMVQILQHSFWLTLRGIAPAVTAVWIAHLGVTLLVRVLPQAGCLHLGMDAGMAVCWLALVLLVCGGAWLWMDDIDGWMQNVRNGIAGRVASQ